MGFTVEHPGILTTVQDEGRFGYERFGMSPAGPMDLTAFHVANILVGNSRGESALEATVMGPTLRFDGDTVIAVTGADMFPKLNGEPCPRYQALAVRAGDQLQMGTVKEGCRAYIAFAGGVDVPPIMGSRSTALVNRVGGMQGRRLEKGDRLSLLMPKAPLGELSRRTAPIPEAQGHEVTVRVVLGPQDDAFTQEGLDHFLSRPYTVSRDFDRMGCRLEGPVIAHKTDGNIISDGIAAGAVQVPTSGQPIIMLAERQTVGGYSKIATVISADLPVVGQCKAGDVVRFRAVSVEEAHKILRETDRVLRGLEERINRPAARRESYYRVTVNGAVFDIRLTPED